MQTGFLLAGFLLFLNPNLEIIDLFPDFIGCALILWGARRLFACSEKGAAASSAFRLLLYTNLAKTAGLLLFFIISDKEVTWLLLLTSVFGVTEAVLFLLGFTRFTEAVTFTAMLHDADGVYDRRLSSFEGMFRLFTVIKCVFSILPELTFLVTDYGTVTLVQTNWDFLFWLLTAVNLLFVTVFGVLTLLLTVKFFRGLARDGQDYLTALREDYRTKIEETPGVLPYRRLRSFASLLFVGTLFLLPLRLDGVDLLPDFVSAGFFIAALLLMRREFPAQAKRGVAASLCYGVLAAAEWVCDLLLLLSTHYSIQNDDIGMSYAKYLSNYLYHDPAAYPRFLALLVLTALRCAAFVPALFCLWKLLRALVTAHTGADLRTVSDPERLPQAQKKTDAVHRHLFHFLAGLSALTLLCAAASFLTKALLLRKSLPFPAWLPEFFLSGLLALLCRVFTYSVADHMDRKYYFSEYL